MDTEEAFNWIDRVAAVAPGQWTPGAINVVLALLDRGDVGTLKRLEAAGIRGPRVWGVLKDVCGGDFDKLASLTPEQLEATP